MLLRSRVLWGGLVVKLMDVDRCKIHAYVGSIKNGLVAYLSMQLDESFPCMWRLSADGLSLTPINWGGCCRRELTVYL
jgi:hypothetical protein